MEQLQRVPKRAGLCEAAICPAGPALLCTVLEGRMEAGRQGGRWGASTPVGSGEPETHGETDWVASQFHTDLSWGNLPGLFQPWFPHLPANAAVRSTRPNACQVLPAVASYRSEGALLCRWGDGSTDRLSPLSRSPSY